MTRCTHMYDQRQLMLSKVIRIKTPKLLRISFKKLLKIEETSRLLSYLEWLHYNNHQELLTTKSIQLKEVLNSNQLKLLQNYLKTICKIKHSPTSSDCRRVFFSTDNQIKGLHWNLSFCPNPRLIPITKILDKMQKAQILKTIYNKNQAFKLVIV